MRKNIFLVAFFIFSLLLTFPSATQASLSKAHDPVTGLQVIYSNVKLQNEPWESIGMWKPLKTGAPYYLELVTNGYKDWIFFNGQVSLHIKDTWYDLISVDQQTTNDWPNVRTTAQFIVPDDAITEIANLRSTDTAEVRLYFQDKTYVLWNIPNKVLVDWQELFQITR